MSANITGSFCTLSTGYIGYTWLCTLAPQYKACYQCTKSENEQQGCMNAQDWYFILASVYCYVPMLILTQKLMKNYNIIQENNYMYNN